MQAFVAVLALAAVAQAGVIAPAGTTILAAPALRSVVAGPALVAGPTISRVPSLDSAVIKSDRIGGNFAYSVSEAHAHAITSPVIQHVAQPVAVSYSAPALLAPQVQLARTVVAGPQIATLGHVGQLSLNGQAITISGAPAGTVLLK